MSTDSTVFIGTWTNWSRGIIYGATLTLPGPNANILIAALALFVGFTGAKSWSILCFVAHQFGVTRRPRDGVYHQLQATLRNNGSDLGTVWEVMDIAWSWSLSARSRSFRKVFGILFIGILHFVLFATAGLLTSRLITLGDEVLVRSANCGEWLPNNISNSSNPEQALFDWATWQTVNADLAGQYFRDCLSGSQPSTEVQSSPECNFFKTLQLPYVTTYNVPCPFSEEMCLGPINNSVTFDTGLLDSCIHLGINAEMKNRVQLRKAMSCAPIATQGFVQDGNATLLNGHFVNFTAVFYGPGDPPIELPGTDSEMVANSTALIEKQNLDFFPSVGTQFYTFIAASAFPKDPEGGFIPIPSLELMDQITTLMFVTYVGSYLSPSEDLWLPAHRPISTPSQTPDGTEMNLTTYAVDNDVSVLGCTEQLQICNPNRGPDETKCTPMLPLNIIEDGFINFNNSGYLQTVLDNENQFTTTSLLLYALDQAFLRTLVNTFDEPPLLLNSLQQQTVSLGLADDQWLQESNHLFSLTLNTIQRYITQFATGPPEPYSQYTTGYIAANPSFKFLCTSQIIRNNNFTSFSILGISLVFGLCGLIICVSLSLETIVAHFQRRFKRGLFQQVRWQLDSKLQLQRIAFEEAGLGVWQGGADQVPTTMIRGQKIELPEEWDEVHPSLYRKIGKRRSARSGSMY